MSNYLRYFIALLLLGSLFHTYTLEVKQSTIKTALDKKLPITIDKKGFVVTLNRIDILGVSDNIVESKVYASLKVSHANKFAKFLPKKSMNISVLSRAIPKLHGKYLSFELLSFKINRLLQIKEVKGVLKKRLEAIKIPLKALDKISWFSSVKDIEFQDDGLLRIHLRVSRWLLLLITPLFLLREIGLFVIFVYQRFISPRKKYRCAKGELYQNGTCSSTTKEAFKKNGFIAGMKAYRASTKECKEAYKILKKDERRDGTSCDADYCSMCTVPCDGSAIGSSTSSCDGCSSLSCEVGSC